MPKTKNGKLTPKQQKFCEQYLIDLNATQAAIRAGYSKNSARRIATENLSKPYIKQVIEKAQLKASDKAEISQQRVLREESRLAFADLRQIFDKNGTIIPITELPEDVARSIIGLEVIEQPGEKTIYKYKFSDKGKALERISRHLGMYQDNKVDITLNIEDIIRQIENANIPRID